MSLDIVGIFDPTPVSDGLNTVTSVVRGKWLDAGLSAVSMVPYIGDLAKAGKLGSWAKTIDDVISMAAKNPDFAKAVDPVLDRIHDAIDSLPSGLPDGVEDTLGAVKSKVSVRIRRSASEEQLALIKAGEIAPDGVTKGMDYSADAIKNFDYGTHLKKLIGPPPPNMDSHHAHHILFKVGNKEAQQLLVQKGQAILRKHGIDPIYGKENLVWAPNITGQHTKEMLEKVVNRLEKVDSVSGTREEIIEVLTESGQDAANLL